MESICPALPSHEHPAQIFYRAKTRVKYFHQARSRVKYASALENKYHFQHFGNTTIIALIPNGTRSYSTAWPELSFTIT